MEHFDVTKHFDVHDQAFGSNDKALSCDLYTSSSEQDSEFRYERLMIQTAPVPSRSAKTQVSFLVAKPNKVQLKLSLLAGSPQEKVVSYSERSQKQFF